VEAGTGVSMTAGDIAMEESDKSFTCFVAYNIPVVFRGARDLQEMTRFIFSREHCKTISEIEH
jgi:hypothetical protein